MPPSACARRSRRARTGPARSTSARPPTPISRSSASSRITRVGARGDGRVRAIRSRSSPSLRASSATSTSSRRWAERGLVAVYVSVTSLEPALARILEPRAAAPHRRIRTIEALARAGVPVGVSVSPIIPFINEPEIERILEAAAAAGASIGVRHRPAPALGGEPAVPALARSALSRSRRARHGANPRDARRQGLRLDVRHADARRRRLGAADRAAPRQGEATLRPRPRPPRARPRQFRKPLARSRVGQGDLFG